VNEKIDKLQSGFTKQLEAMQILLNQQLDTRLSSLSEALIEETKETKNQSESSINQLQAEVEKLTSNVKKMMQGADRLPQSGSKSPMRTDSTPT
jgi:hypothetical protein